MGYNFPALGFSPWAYYSWDMSMQNTTFGTFANINTNPDIPINGEIYHGRIFKASRWVCIGWSVNRTGNLVKHRYSNWNGQDVINDTPSVPARTVSTGSGAMRNWDDNAHYWGKSHAAAGIAHDACNIYMTDEYIDLTDNAEWAKFFDTSTLRPIYLGDSGEIPTGTSAALYSPDGDLTNNLGTGGDWTKTGTIATSSRSPTDDDLP
jgi:hypothetical protein